MRFIETPKKFIVCLIGDLDEAWFWMNREFASYSVKSWRFTDRDKLFYDLDEIDSADEQLCVIEFKDMPSLQIVKDIKAYKYNREIMWCVFEHDPSEASEKLEDFYFYGLS